MGWNAVWLVLGLSLIVAAGEAWFKSTTPFRSPDRPTHFVPGVGLLWEPHAKIHRARGRDFSTTTRVNHLGFLDREPPDAERAAASCHVAIIGDSYVEAQQVPIADKAQVRLEELAARRLPELDVTTSAYGRGGTGQVDQLPYYDEYARRLRPKLVVLVFAERDGFRLAVLSVHTAGAEGDPQFDRMRGMAEARGIPVIDQYDYIVRQGARVEEANWRRDHHWNAAGHRWAAEALLEWLERNRDVCRPGGGAPRGAPVANLDTGAAMTGTPAPSR